jgi:FMN phosphatase YigB (HAD superfamily)
MVVEGVLTNHLREPIPAGEKLYRALTPVYRVVLSTDRPGEDITRHVMGRGLRAHAHIRASEEALADVDIYARHLEQERAAGGVEMLIDSNPERVEAAINAGVPGILISHPMFTLPEYRADFEGPLKPWRILEEGIQRRALQQAGFDLDADPEIRNWES